MGLLLVKNNKMNSRIILLLIVLFSYQSVANCISCDAGRWLVNSSLLSLLIPTLSGIIALQYNKQLEREQKTMATITNGPNLVSVVPNPVIPIYRLKRNIACAVLALSSLAFIPLFATGLLLLTENNCVI